MKKFLLCATFYFCVQHLFSQSPPFAWAHNLGGVDDDKIYNSFVDTQGNLYVTGSYAGLVDFDPEIASLNLYAVLLKDIFIAKYAAEGTLVWAKSIGGTLNDVGSAIIVDDVGNVYVAGSFWNTVDFNPDAGVANLTSNGGADLFIMKYGPCTNSFSSITGSGCQSYTVNGITYSASGSYSQTIPNALGCDSIISLNITITQPDISVQQNGPSLMAVATGVFYQWINCNNGNAAINGAINQTYNATANGSYAVIITQGNCADTSVCYTVTGVGIDDLNPTTVPSVFPNPANNILTIEISATIESITIYNTLGEMVMLQNTKTFSVKSLAKGVYYALIKSNKGIGSVRFAIE